MKLRWPLWSSRNPSSVPRNHKATLWHGAGKQIQNRQLPIRFPSCRKHLALSRSLGRVERCNGKAYRAVVSQGSWNKDTVDFEAPVSKGQSDVSWRGQKIVLGKSKNQKQTHCRHNQTHWSPWIRSRWGICRSQWLGWLWWTLICL